MYIDYNKLKQQKDVEVLFQKQTYDTKKIINRSEKKIDISVLDIIEKGITSEQLDEMQLPIYKYMTQITIHGIFPDIGGLYVGGYKQIFQNKNKSIGVRYNAIDFDKKRRIYTAFGQIHQFNIYQNSSEYYAYKLFPIKTKEDYNRLKEQYTPFLDKINLQFGGTLMYRVKHPMYGTFLVLNITINAIYEKDIPEFFLNVFGRTEEDITNEREEKKRQEEERRRIESEEWDKRRKEENANAEVMVKNETDRLSALGYQWVTDHPVKEALTIFSPYVDTDYNTRKQTIKYLLRTFSKQPRERLFRYASREFQTLEETLEHQNEISVDYCSNKFRKNTISGFILNK